MSLRTTAFKPRATRAAVVPSAGRAPSAPSASSAPSAPAAPPVPPVAPAAGPREATTARRSFLTPDRLLGAAVFAGALTVGLWNVTDATAFQDDEGTYTAQALAANQGSLGPYTYWYDHPPFGWFQIAGLALVPRALGLGDGSALAATRPVMGLLFAVTVTLVFLVARRLALPRVIAVLTAGLLVASPLALSLGRQVFLDNVATPWVLLAVWLALSPRRALWAHVGAGAAFGAALLTKLTAAVFGPALLIALLATGRWRSRAFSLTGFLMAGALVVMLFPLLAVLRFELTAGPGHVSLQEGLLFQLATRETSGSFWDSGSDRHSLVIGWFEQSQVLVVAGLVGALLCLAAARTRWLTVALLSFAVPMLLSQGYLPAMYVVGALPFLALAAGAGAGLAWTALVAGLTRLQGRYPALRGERRRRVTASVLAVAALVAVASAALPEWRARSLPLATAQANQDWRDAVGWVEANVPATDDIVVPFSAWNEVQDQGRGGPWNVVALEKVDRDTEFALVHPEGWRSIEWILEGPTVGPNITDLELDEMAQALRSSTVVASFGAWNVRQVDQVDQVDPAPTTQQEDLS